MTVWRLDDLPGEVRKHVEVDPDSGCWLWSDRLNAHGYGMLGNTFVHRLVFTLLAGPIAPGLTIDHVKARGCTSKACCWPAHLEPVTRAENTRRNVDDMTRRRRRLISKSVLPANELRQKWKSTLNTVEHNGEHITVLRYDTPAAVLVPVEWYKQAQQALGKENGL